MGISVPPDYRPLSELGHGAMGLIVKARHEPSGRVCALKLMRDTRRSEVELRRFQREARALILLKHPKVVDVLDVGIHEGSPYLALEHIEGRDLFDIVIERLRSGDPVDWAWLKPRVRDFAEALAYCHEQGVVHRDVKPQNLLIDEVNKRAVLIDFGLLKAADLESEGTLTLTRSNAAMGTPAFMAPEQFYPKGGFGEVGPASDIWGLGATLFFALSGRPPYDGGSALEIAETLMKADPPSLAGLVKDLPADVERLIAACLTRAADKRPTAEHLLEFLDLMDAEPPRRRAGKLAALGLTALVLITGGAALALRQSEAPQPDRAQEAPVAKPRCADERLSGVAVARDGALRFENLGPEPVTAYIDGRRFPLPASGRLPLGPGLGPRKLRLRAGKRELLRLEAVPIADLERFRSWLADVEAWSKATEDEQDAAIAWLLRRLGDGFELRETRRYRCGGQEFRIATLEHRASGIELQLIPGSSFRTRWPRSTRRRTLATQLDMELCARIELPVVTLSAIAEQRELKRWGPQVFGELSESDRSIAARFLDAIGDDRKYVPDEPEIRAALRRFFARYAERRAKAESVFSDQPVAPFLIGRFELTRGQQERLGGRPRPGSLDLPAVELNFDEALALAAKGGLRLPSRIEWQYACAAGSKGLYFWGDDRRRIPEFCWFNENAEQVRPGVEHVDQANAFGLVDTLGNACEWAAPDWDRWREAMLGSGLRPPGGKTFEAWAQEHRAKLGASMGANLAYGWTIQQCGYFYYTPRERRGKAEDKRPPRYGVRLALSLPDLLP